MTNVAITFILLSLFIHTGYPTLYVTDSRHGIDGLAFGRTQGFLLVRRGSVAATVSAGIVIGLIWLAKVRFRLRGSCRLLRALASSKCHRIDKTMQTNETEAK